MEELNINSMNLLQIDLTDESAYYGKKFRKLNRGFHTSYESKDIVRQSIITVFLNTHLIP